MPAVDRKELRRLVNDARDEARTTVFDDEGLLDELQASQGVTLLPTNDQDALHKRLRAREREYILDERENARREAAIASAALIGDDGLDANGRLPQPSEELEEVAEVVLTGYLDKKLFIEVLKLAGLRLSLIHI